MNNKEQYERDRKTLIESILNKQTKDQYTRKDLEKKSISALQIIEECIY